MLNSCAIAVWLCIGFALLRDTRTAHANLGETFTQINTRYGQPLKKLPDSLVREPGVSTYRYEFNNRRIFITFLGGTSVSEAIRAPDSAPHFTEKVCLAIAAQISGKTNWSELNRRADGVVWVASGATASLQKDPSTPDYVFVSNIGYDIRHLLRDPDLALTPSQTNRPAGKPEAVQPDTKP